jgi:hypothetical protein
MKTYREFIAWQKAMGFVTSVYKLTRATAFKISSHECTNKFNILTIHTMN